MHALARCTHSASKGAIISDVRGVSEQSYMCNIQTSDALDSCISEVDGPAVASQGSVYSLDDQLSDDDLTDLGIEKALPEGLMDSAKCLHKSLLDVDHALSLFVHQALQRSSGLSPTMERAIRDIQAIRQHLSERAVPEVASRLAESRKRGFSTGTNNDPIDAHQSSQNSDMCAARCGSHRPPPLDLKSHSLRATKSDLFPDCGVVTGSPRRLREHLIEIMKHNKRKDVSRTLAVFGITKLGTDSLGRLRKYVDSYGRSDLIVQPKPMWAPGFALVTMDDASMVDRIVLTGEAHVVGNVELSVRRLETFMDELHFRI
eukprot:TRINITY_DN25488_c0_g1_i1.p1 TRINITY_DN25488_c0_g1~~TRINITY_DN25488_c0_g1_i1.p1  ORF type:complete len:317 (+),score=23.51 TRINITY_DN25488_c0_g1_i1:39-989(+)